MVSDFPGQRPREEQASHPTTTPAFPAILSWECFILVTNIRLNTASPASSLQVRALHFPPSNFPISIALSRHPTARTEALQTPLGPEPELTPQL